MTQAERRLDEALDILYDYKGNNPYIHMVKRDIYIDKKENSLTDFKVDFILENKDVNPTPINKITKIPDWYGENRKIAWGLDFVPEKIKIVSYCGEADGYYCCYVKYRQTVDPVMCFIPKNAVLNNFFVEDYHDYKVDFNRYDNLSSAKDPTRVLKEHQKEAVQFLLSRKRCILADDMGLGKSCELSVAAIEGNFDSVLIICPATLKNDWKRELMWYVPERDITIVEGGFEKMKKEELETFIGYPVGKTKMKKAELIQEAKEKGKWRENRFVIVNYDILDEFYDFSRAYTEESKQRVLDNSPILKYIHKKKSCLIVDEAHRLSNNKSQRYKVIQGLIKKGNPDSVFLATGTPITNNPLNLFYILHLIENQVTCDMDAYKYRYCEAELIYKPGEYDKWKIDFLFGKQLKENPLADQKELMKYVNENSKQLVRQLTSDEYEAMRTYINDHADKLLKANGASNLDELKECISHLYLRRVKDDVLTLPGKNIHEIFYDLSSQQLSEYNKLWDEYEEAQLTADPEKELNKDLLEGGIYRRYLSNEMVGNTIKLADKILETEGKIIIATCYDEELYTLKEYYGKQAVIINGKCTPKEKEKNKYAFIDNPEIKVLIGNIEACGVGLTLVVAKSLIFNNMSFVAGDNRQMEDRIHRMGQTKEVDIYYQIFRNTQYQHMWDIVLRKQLIIDKVIKTENEK